MTGIPMKTWLMFVALAGVILLTGSGCAADWQDEDEAVSAAFIWYDLFELCLVGLAMLVIASFISVAAMGFIGNWLGKGR